MTGFRSWLFLNQQKHGRENQRGAAEKGPPFGRFGIFQTRPDKKFLNIFSGVLTTARGTQ
jgi:hypothetical protein